MAQRATEPIRVTPEEVARRMAQGEELLILDARSRQAYRLSPVRILGAQRLPPSEPHVALKDLPSDKPAIIYCDQRGEATSGRMARLLLERGWSNVQVLRGGFEAWLRAGYPVETKD